MDSAVNGLLPVAVRVAEVVIGAVGSAWLVAKATKAHSISVAREIADNQTKVDAGLEGIRAQLQRQTQNASFYSQRKHAVYAKLFRRLNETDGALCGRAVFRKVPDVDRMNGRELDELAAANELAASIRDNIRLAWERGDQQSARTELCEALNRAEQARGLRAFRGAKNYFIVNALYLSPEIDAQIQALIGVFGSYSAEIEYPDPNRWQRRSDLAAEVGTSLAKLREAMRRELQGGSAEPATP